MTAWSSSLGALVLPPATDLVSYDNTTTGNVNYTSGIGPNALISGGQAVLRVDNGTVVNNGTHTLRGSAKIRTREAYGMGSIFVLDAAHVPYGCSVWPAFYTVSDQSLQQWPQGGRSRLGLAALTDAGEFDIYEQQNLGPFNQLSLHVAGPNNVTRCTMPSSTLQAARHTADNCDAWTNYNVSCWNHSRDAQRSGWLRCTRRPRDELGRRLQRCRRRCVGCSVRHCRRHGALEATVRP